MAEYECLEDFIPVIRMEISDVDDRTIKMILGAAQQKFCRDTRVLQQTVDSTIDATNDTYACIPQWEGFNQTIDVVAVGRTVSSARPLEFGSQWFISEDRNSIILDENYLKPSLDGFVIQILSTVIPYLKTTLIKPSIYELYSESILILAKHMLYNQKRKPWSDMQSAEALLYEYNDVLNSVNYDTIAGGNTSGEQTINLDF